MIDPITQMAAMTGWMRQQREKKQPPRPGPTMEAWRARIPQDLEELNPKPRRPLPSEMTRDELTDYASNLVMPMAGTLGKAAMGRSLDDVANTWRQKGLTVDLSPDGDGAVRLSRVIVPKELRGSGLGSAFMDDLSRYADESGVSVRLSPSTDFGATSVSRLKDFYKRFGFVENKGRNRDFTTRESMYRTPPKPK